MKSLCVSKDFWWRCTQRQTILKLPVHANVSTLSKKFTSEQLKRTCKHTLDSKMVTSIPNAISCRAAVRPAIPAPIIITLPCFLAAKKGFIKFLLQDYEKILLWEELFPFSVCSSSGKVGLLKIAWLKNEALFFCFFNCVKMKLIF